MYETSESLGGEARRVSRFIKQQYLPNGHFLGFNAETPTPLLDGRFKQNLS